jgi:ubiquinone/menaquinone biosynthesis C-methylase UbiE
LRMVLHVKPVYERWAEEYDNDSKRNPAIQMEDDAVIPFLDPNKQDVILEVGCGTGRLTIPIAKECGRITGIDFSEQMLGMARRKSLGLSNVEFRKVDARKKLPFQDASFDKVLAALVINHIENLAEFLTEVHRVLKRGGTFVFDDVVPDAEFFETRQDTPLVQAYKQDKKVFSVHSLDDCVNSLHRVNFDVKEIRFARFDEKIKHTVTKKTFEMNRGHTYGWIFKARKPD